MDGAKSSTIHKPLIEHVHDLRKHLLWIALAVAVCGGGAYAINEQLLKLLQAPLGQSLYYTSPTGGISFLFKLCLVAGVIAALPVIIYNAFKFFQPVLSNDQQRGLFKYTVWSFFLAYAGIAFAYFISLPAALHFLTGFGNQDIQSLINVNEYFNFALAYVGGFAALFQLPIIILFINRIKPLKPMQMMKAQRFIILGSFIIAAMLTPTPDPFNQLMMAAPLIVLYQVSIILVTVLGLKGRKKRKAAATFNERSIPEEAYTALLDEPVQKPSYTQNLTPSKPALARSTRPIFSDVMPARPQRRQAVQPRPLRVEPTVTARPLMFSGTTRRLVGNDFSM